jgi:predicted RNA-binding Zn-ribbon protein involved in translation (DUF1610 family)
MTPRLTMSRDTRSVLATTTGGHVPDDKPAQGRWEQLNKCPECGEEMQRDTAVGERIGLFYRCPQHGRFRYSWDHDRLERE